MSGTISIMIISYKKGGVYEMPNKNNNEVEPYSIGKAIIIIVALALFDTVGCIVLLVGSIIFVKMGHKGLGIALCVTNILIPDALPVVDELFQIVVIAIPLYQSYKKGESLKQAATKAIDSHNEYNGKNND